VKSLVLAAAAVMIATVAQAETVYVTPGSVVHWLTKAPFKTAISGDEELLVVHPGATNQDLLISASQPDGTLTGSANVVMIDDQGKLVENLHVEVTPFGGPAKAVQVLRDGKSTTYLCANNTCLNAGTGKSRKGMGDADSVTVTRHRDGSTDTWKHSTTPPGI
jgi:hypothetical protein